MKNFEQIGKNVDQALDVVASKVVKAIDGTRASIAPMRSCVEDKLHSIRVHRKTKASKKKQSGQTDFRALGKIACFILGRSDAQLIDYCTTVASKARDVYNSALFVARQIFTSASKEPSVWTSNERQVRENMKQISKYKNQMIVPKYTLESYVHRFCPWCYELGLYSQVIQQLIFKAADDMKYWMQNLKKYRHDPTGYTGCPKMPKYKKNVLNTFYLTNQAAHLDDDDPTLMHFPMTELTKRIRPLNGRIKQVEVKPYYDTFKITIVYDASDASQHDVDPQRVMGIDLGVDNIAAIVCHDECRLYKGNEIKAKNQWFNKHRAELISKLMKQDKSSSVSSKRLMQMSKYRANYLRDTFHKISRDIIDLAIKYHIGTIVIGSNRDWKQSLDMLHDVKLNFVSIPFDLLKQMLIYKGEAAGIQVVLAEESYTSKASHLDGDDLPTYDPDHPCRYKFSGRRVRRGFYRSANGQKINADLNGAANIVRKVFPETHFSFKELCNVSVASL